MVAGAIDRLFSPFELIGLELGNRFVMPAMQRGQCEQGRPSSQMADYYRSRVNGGISLVIGEGAAVGHPSSTSQEGAATLSPIALEGWKESIDAVERAGGRMLIQLWHEGAVRKELSSSSPSLSPSGLIQAGVPNGRAATAEELDELKAAYVHGALAAQSIGASGVEVHAAHGYFLDLFLWEETNQRSDGYGGSDIRQRVRYPAEIVSAIREEVGEDFVISFRFSQWKEVDFDAAIVDTPEELSVMLDVLCGAGVDVFHASTRRILDAEWPERSALGLAGWTKKLSRMPVIAVGSVGLDTDLMDNLFGKEAIPTGEAGLSSVARKLEDGEFDLVSVGRAVIGDADWVKKVHQGRWAEMRPFCKDDMMQEWEMGFVLDAHQ